MNLIWFEWKLLTRNKRLRQISLLAMLCCFIIYMELASSTLLKESFVIKECFLWAIFAVPANFATFAFSANAAFIEKQLISPLPVFKILQAKYRLFCILSTVLFMMFLPSIFLGIKFVELFAAFLFSVGFVFFGLFYLSLFSYRTFDIKSSTFFNYQDLNIGNYFFPILVLIVAFGFTAVFYWLFNEMITLIAMSLIGSVFIVFNKLWLGKISRNFEKTRYCRLEYFREK